MVYDQDAEGNEIIRPSARAIEARDRWLKANPHYKDRMRGHLTGPAQWTDAELDAMVDRWQRITGAIPDDDWLKATVGYRMARLRRERRRFRLVLFLTVLTAGALAALLVQITALHWHL